MTVIVFDLDDTLYDELTYVRSGFLAVAKELGDKFGVPVKETFEWMWQRLGTHGRGKVFDDCLNQIGHYSQSQARKCLRIYRMHSPNIQLDQEAEACINRLGNYPMYVVTDGNKVVQDRKLKALGLYDRMSFCYVTHRYGMKNAKPSPYCFWKIADREKTTPDQIVYIGDNPHKDFVGIKREGFRTIRIMKGQHREVRKPPEYEAEVRIYSLDELDQQLLDQLF